ncbi:VOC family protein [Rhodobacteraceae bacterium R_SAG10]|jgi:predicted enzyme related to lactoylglutathione lyase|nr:VOC family protein [Rhodobacteraceae bacterium R_SAG10]
MAIDHPPTVVWSAIPVSDMDASIAFYNAVFNYSMTINTDGPNPTAWFPSQDSPSAHGHIYPGKSAAADHGITLHLAIPGKLEYAIQRCKDAGGEVTSPIVAIPPGRFTYARDLDGNSLGLFEPAAI